MLEFLLSLLLLGLLAIALHKKHASHKPHWHRPPKQTNDPRSQVIKSLQRAPMPSTAPPPKNPIQPLKPLGKVSKPPAIRNHPGNQNRMRQILKLVNHDQAVATRLIESTKQKHPNQSEHWILEKVIWDLERDRQ